MSIISKLLGMDKVIEGGIDIAKSGMKIWDNADFTAQERTSAFINTVKVMASKETALSRRILLWALICMVGFVLVVGVIWIGLGADDRVVQLVALVEALKIGYGFVAAIGFYYLTHIVKGGKK